MTDDDVLREVRAAREAFAEAHGFDPHAMVAALRELDAAGDWPVRRVGREEVTARAGDTVAPNPAGTQSRPAGERGR